MKKIVAVLVILAFSQFPKAQQFSEKLNNDTIQLALDVPLFQVDSCLRDLLEAVVEDDSQAVYFSQGRDQIVYTLDFKNHGEYIDMFLWPMRVTRFNHTDYSGALNVSGMIFLCRGDYKNLSIFKKVDGSNVKIVLKKPKKTGTLDKIDKSIFQLVDNISLFGTYAECTGFKIVTSIYIEGRMREYQPVRHDKSQLPRTTKANADIISLSKAYNNAFDSLGSLLSTNGSFKKAVFITEHAYFNNDLPLSTVDEFVDGLVYLCKEWKKANHLKEYKFRDSSDLLNNLAIYKVLKDTIKTIGPNGEIFDHLPLSYDFNDFFGREKWSNMFVSKLLVSQTGNCHSFPYLYKILADELGATCWLSLAPNHIYIKNRCQKIGWYNTELTSGDFPIDAWITTSGYIPLKAVQTGIYMDTLSNQQAIALCVLDLAKGYQFQMKNYADGFIIKCCDLVLQHHPVNVQALLLKAETLKRNYEVKKTKGYDDNNTFLTMQTIYLQLLDLGYREMPDDMYMQWLLSVNTQRHKYSNTQMQKVLGSKN